ncbi:NAD(P)H-hydrate dehydratase [Loktanella sp. Alg231-35]|uniref:NAD(P)H-hydrate dehydratase n=1 Tax=Loktanella sp. Alg231-35 TaxID=1922220 RepID=UPI000D55B79B|nr:NAD(P)H-hydrate dehydratase [Loktanella sp. Alg231-35]
MTELLTAAQMRAIEQAAIASGEVTGLELMERAGRGVVEAIFEEWPELAQGAHRTVVLCGPGNNGGDGFVVARLLKEAGWEVEVFLYGDAAKLPPDAKVNCERWVEGNGKTRAIGDDTFISHAIIPSEILGDPLPNIVIDALFGSGLSRPLLVLPELRAAIQSCASVGASDPNWPKVVSVDVPSGMDSDCGTFLGYKYPSTEKPDDECIRANLTVTFETAFVGHFLSYAPKFCLKVVIKSIGLDAWLTAYGNCRLLGAVTDPFIMDKGYWGFHFDQEAHKYSHGHALILSGSVGKGGAARLAARGALRVGAGAVTLGSPPAALIENAAQLNAIMLQKIKTADDLITALTDTRINALCLGPGMGTNTRAVDLLAAALERTRPGLDPGPHAGSDAGPGSGPGRGVVLDADALTMLARDKALFALLHEACVLTPHAGEFARVFPDIAEKLAAPATKGPAYSKVDATREAAKRAGCVVLFKGPDTVIADPSGRCSINASVYERSAPWLATAGSGDVLAGFITGLLARGFAPMQAAETGAWLHTECALSFGPGLIAEDLPEELPKVFRSLGI